MTALPFRILTTPEFDKLPTRIARAGACKPNKILKTIRLLRDVGRRHPALNAHKYRSLTGPNGEDIWEVYVENKTPGLWRLWWCYGPDADTITLCGLVFAWLTAELGAERTDEPQTDGLFTFV